MSPSQYPRTALAASVLLSLGMLAVAGLPGLADRTTAGPVPAQESLHPYDPAPEMAISTTTGTLVVGGGPGTLSTLFVGRNPLSASSEAIWAGSVDKLLAETPTDTQIVFYSYQDTAAAVQADMEAMATRVDAAIAALSDEARREHWRSHVFYLPDNPLTEGSELSELLLSWGRQAAEVEAEWIGADDQPAALITVGTTDTGWARPLTETLTLDLARYGNLACGQDAPVDDLTGRAALTERGSCTFSEKVANADKHGAAAAILYSDGRPLVWMGASCSPCPDIPVIMIETQPGRALREQLDAGRPVTVTLTPIQLGADSLAIDRRGRLREFGTIPFPFSFQGFTNPDPMQLVAKEAQLYHFEQGLDERLAAEDAAGKTVMVPVYEGTWASDPGWTGQQAIVDVMLPDAAAMARFDKLEVELTLSCDENNRKGGCPAWDYLVYLYLCDNDSETRCRTEFGRWITPYWSGGRWVTDLSPMLALLTDGGPQRFGFWTVQRYKLDMTFRLTDTGAQTAPKVAHRILSGGAFWKDYNKDRFPMVFAVPDWAKKVELASLLTGHGNGRDLHNCGEFCNHTHHIVVNGGPEHVRAHPEAGTDYDCLNRVSGGVVPNQAGTWVFGRAGWCPGLDVPMWQLDITPEVQAGWNTLTYQGLFNGADYISEPIPPATGPPDGGYDARIELTGWVVYYGDKDATAGAVPPPYESAPSTVTLPLLYNGPTQ